MFEGITSTLQQALTSNPNQKRLQQCIPSEVQYITVPGGPHSPQGSRWKRVRGVCKQSRICELEKVFMCFNDLQVMGSQQLVGDAQAHVKAQIPALQQIRAGTHPRKQGMNQQRFGADRTPQAEFEQKFGCCLPGYLMKMRTTTCCPSVF